MSQSSNPPTDQTPNKPTVSPKEAKALLWKKGILHWKLDSNQKGMYDMLGESKKKIDVIVSSRQIGKSYLLATYAIEYCMKNPNSFVKMIAPQLQMIRNITRPVMREILLDCPKDIEPTIPTNTNLIKFKNGSEIQLAGTDAGNADALRGTKAHLVIVDEAAFCDDLDYLIKSILVPMTTTTKGRIILSSTPPKNNDHPFSRFWDKAAEDGSLIKRTVYDCPRLSQDEIQMLAESSGGFDSVDFRREYLCQKIISEEDAVVPEFTDELQAKIVKQWPRPPYYDSYASMDLGVTDQTVVLFGYYDYKSAKIIIEDELVEGGKTLLADTFGKAIVEKEKNLWKHPLTGEQMKVYLRVADNNNPQFLNEIHNKCGLTFLPTQKMESDAALNVMRMLIKNERIIINPRCTTLIAHLKNAVWNKSRTSYIRSPGQKHHYDAVDALKYLCRNINFNKDPYPPGYQIGHMQDLFFTEKPNNNPQLHQQLKAMFQIKRPRPHKR